MTTMLDKCAVAGDITQGIDRRGVWTAAITVIGGTSGTAVKLVSSDTVNGEYTDYKTLISAADAETDQYKGFVVDLHGAKKFIKVTGAVMATAVFGDCDHDVKNIAITAGEVPSGADLEDNKEVEITENGEIEITPSAGKDGMKKVTATVNVSGGDLEDNKAVSITENGVVEITPTTGKDGMKKVTATVNVSGGAELEDNKTVSITENGVVEITPTTGKDGMKKVTATVNVAGAELEDNKTVSITKNGVVEITPTAGKDGMKKVTATVTAATEISNLNTSAEIPATVGTSQAMTVVNPPDTPVSLVYIQPFRNGQGGVISHSVSIADILANGSATLELEIGPGKLTCTVTAVVDPHYITVTFEIASVASDYFGGSIRGVVV